MRVTVERIEPKDEEELIVRCYDPGAAWVSSVTEAASGHRTICGWQEDTRKIGAGIRFPTWHRKITRFLERIFRTSMSGWKQTVRFLGNSGTLPDGYMTACVRKKAIRAAIPA